jgi:hypothetical protein
MTMSRSAPLRLQFQWFEAAAACGASVADERTSRAARVLRMDVGRDMAVSG